MRKRYFLPTLEMREYSLLIQNKEWRKPCRTMALGVIKISRLQDVASTRLPTRRAHRRVTAITIRQSRDYHCTRETPASLPSPPPGLFLFRTTCSWSP